jgi:hypothetical protein
MKTFRVMMKHLDGSTSFRDDCCGGNEWHLREGSEGQFLRTGLD